MISIQRKRLTVNIYFGDIISKIFYSSIFFFFKKYLIIDHKEY